MKQSTKKYNREQTAFLYVRLSKDDKSKGDSYSIQNQKKLLTQIAKEKGYTNLVTFLDDGITGVTTKRPGFQEMLTKLEQGYASALFVKDLSRLYRNRTEADKLVDDFLPEHEIRLVSVGDGVDTGLGEDEFIFLRNWANEQYAKDISKKRRLSNRARGNAGEPLSSPPYGYIYNPDNPKMWMVDDEAAEVVRRIYSLVMEGYGPVQIANILSDDKILIPMFYFLSKGIRKPGRMNKERIPTQWNKSTIQSILQMQEYCGDIINFKTYSKSFKNKKRIPNAPENMAVFKDVHAPVIDRSLWEKVQEKRKNSTIKQPVKSGTDNMFAGLLFCADCGATLNFHFNQKNHDIKYYNCSNNNNRNKTCNKTHYIRLEFLEQVVLAEIRRLAQFASHYEDTFVEAVMKYSQQNAETHRKSLERKLKSLKTRYKELDVIFKKLYEDNVTGKISDERFSAMSGGYETEQLETGQKMNELQTELDAFSAEEMTTDVFTRHVRKYTRVRKLTQHILNELIERIEVFHAEKIDGKTVQRLIIRYNCIGTIEIPEFLPEPEIELQTRQGKSVSYLPICEALTCSE